MAQKQKYALDFYPELQAKRSLEITNTMPYYESVDSVPSRFGDFGGRYIPETLLEAHRQLEELYVKCSQDPEFQIELENLGKNYIGRPTPLYFAERLTKAVGGAKIYLKREDLAHTGAHKINNALAQGLLAKRIGKKRIICETGAGQHGVATATACSLLNLSCVVYMGSEDIERQKLNVFRMKLLGAEVIKVESGTKTLKDAVNEAMRDWTTNVETTHYIIGSAIGPHPFPTIVRDFQSVIGRETLFQLKQQQLLSKTKVCVACVGGGSNAIGLFSPVVKYNETLSSETQNKILLVGAEAAGESTDLENNTKHCATLCKGKIGVLHGTKTLVLQTASGQISETHSISAGLDYPGVGPEHAFYLTSNKAVYTAVSDSQALQSLEFLAKTEGIICALESAHAVHEGIQRAKRLNKDEVVVVLISGRGDKDMTQVAKIMGVNI